MILYLFVAIGGAILGVVLFSLCNMARERLEVARYRSALWEVIHGVRSADTYYIGVRNILEKRGIEIPEDEVVW